MTITGSIRGLCVARNGFQRGAREVATSEDIQLINLREVEDKDWDGRIKTIGISLHIISPARIVCVEPEFNKKWSVEHGYKDGDIVTLSGLNTEIVLEDKGSDFKSSLYDMTNNEFINKSPGEHVWEKSFSDGWLRTKEKSFKVDKIRVIYSIPPPAKENIEIDFSRHVLAILEYVQRNTKFTILADGTKKEFVE